MQQLPRHVLRPALSCAVRRFASFVSSRGLVRAARPWPSSCSSSPSPWPPCSFESREQQLTLNELEAQSWTMRAELDRRASPAELEKAAKANGMVPAGTSGFITLETGTVEGGTPAK